MAFLIIGIVSCCLFALAIWVFGKHTRLKYQVNKLREHENNEISVKSGVPHIGHRSVLKSISGNDISSDSIIAKHWQHNQFDIKMVTSGAIHFNDMKTKGNKDVSGEIADPIQIKNDQLIAAEVAKNDQGIYEFTRGRLDKTQWKTKE